MQAHGSAVKENGKGASCGEEHGDGWRQTIKQTKLNPLLNPAEFPLTHGRKTETTLCLPALVLPDKMKHSRAATHKTSVFSRQLKYLRGAERDERK